jgi:hypothetical protein
MDATSESVSFSNGASWASIFTITSSGVVGKRLPPLQSHAFEWVRDWVRVIAALHHAIDKVEKPSLDGIRDTTIQTDQSRSNHHLISFLLLSFVS